MKMLSALFLLTFFSSCVEYCEENKVYGIYVPVDYKNNFDTIQLKPNGVYHRRVYDINKKMLLEMNGKWRLEHCRFILDGFYVNLDDDLVRFPDNVNDTAMEINTYFESHKGKIQFCGVGHHIDQNCYQKIN